jgi:hypothetical protein
MTERAVVRHISLDPRTLVDDASLSVTDAEIRDYYRANPERLRVVNKVVDAISLAETEVRANAFRASLAARCLAPSGRVEQGPGSGHVIRR